VAHVTTGGRRERKKHQTSVALAEAALRLFAERGFAETTVEEIADAADMSSRTFFRHFSSKEAVVFADEPMRRDIWIDAMRVRPADEPALHSVREATLVLAEDYSPDRDFFRFELARKHRTVGSQWFQIAMSWESLLAEEIADRLELGSRFDVTARTLAASAMAAWRVAIDNWAFERGRDALRSHVDRSFTVLTHLGALTPPVVTNGAVVDVRAGRPESIEK
jgi:AcrR family transcriptional regulator